MTRFQLPATLKQAFQQVRGIHFWSNLATQKPSLRQILTVGGSAIALLSGGVVIPVLAQNAPTPIMLNSTVTGRLEAGDTQFARDNSYLDSYRFEGRTGQRILIVLTSAAFDPYLILLDANGNSLSQNDDGGGDADARIEYTLPADGVYTIYANSYTAGEGGNYNLILQAVTASAPTPTPEATGTETATDGHGPASSQPRYFCGESGDVPQTMARRKDGLVDWLIRWTPDTAVGGLSAVDRCRRVSSNLERIHRTLGRDFQITTSKISDRFVVCAANVRLNAGQVEYARGECAPDGQILTAASARDAASSAQALNERITLLNSAPAQAIDSPPAASPTPSPDSTAPVSSPLPASPTPSPTPANPSPSPDSANPSPSPTPANPSPSPDSASPTSAPDSANPSPPPPANPSPAPDPASPTPSPESASPSPAPASPTPSPTPESSAQPPVDSDPPSTAEQSIAVPYQFSFTTALGYSNCLEDIIQLHQDPGRLTQQGRRSDCLPEVFAHYSNGISRAQALELITAANNYVANKFSNVLIYPPRGQRVRIQQLFGYTYNIDQ